MQPDRWEVGILKLVMSTGRNEGTRNWAASPKNIMSSLLTSIRTQEPLRCGFPSQASSAFRVIRFELADTKNLNSMQDNVCHLRGSLQRLTTYASHRCLRNCILIHRSALRRSQHFDSVAFRNLYAELPARRHVVPLKQHSFLTSTSKQLQKAWTEWQVSFSVQAPVSWLLPRSTIPSQ